MINHLANRVASVFVSYGECSEENADIYAYALEAIFASLINFSLCIFISLLFGKLPEGLIFITVFAVFRRILGGYHAKSHSSCILTFSIFVLLTMILLSLFDTGFFITITLLFIAVSGILIIKIINRLNKSLLSIKKINKLDGIIIACICSLNIFVSVYGTNQIGFTISLSIFVVFVSLLIQLIEDRKEVTNHE